MNAATGGDFLRTMWQDGPTVAFNQSHLNPVYVPLTWFGALLLGCENLLGVAYLFLVGAAFLIVRLSARPTPSHVRGHGG